MIQKKKQTSILETCLFISLLLPILLYPIFAAKMYVMAIFTSLVFSLILVFKKINITLDKRFSVLLALNLIFFWLITLLATNRYMAIESNLKLSIFFLYALLISWSINTRNKKIVLSSVIVAFFLIVLFISLFQFFKIKIKLAELLILLTFLGNTAKLGNYLAIVLAFKIPLIFINYRNKILFPFLLLSTIIGVIILLKIKAIFSFIGFTVTALTLIFIVFSDKKLKASNQATLAKLLVLPLIMVILATVVFLPINLTYLGENASQNYGLTYSWPYRTLLAKDSLSLIKNNLLFGVAPGNFPIRLPQYKSPELWETFFAEQLPTIATPQNDYILLLAELGIIGFLLFISLLAYSLFIGLKNYYNANTLFNKFFSLSTFSGLLCCLVIMFFSSLLTSPIFMIFLFSFIGMIHSSSASSSEKKHIIIRARTPIFIIIGVLLFTALSIFTISRIKIETGNTYMNKGEIFIKQGRYEKALANLIKAQSYIPNDTRILKLTGDAYRRLRRFNSAIKVYEKYNALIPFDYKTLLNTAICYEQVDNRDKAIEYYHRVNNIKEQQITSIKIAHIYHQDKNYEKVIECCASIKEKKFFQETAGVMLLEAYFNATDEAGTLEYGQKIEKYHEDSLLFNTIMADNFTKLKMFDKANSYLQKALKIQPSTPLLFKIAFNFQQAGKFRKALGYYQQVLKLRKPDKEIYYNMAVCLESIGENLNAIYSLREITEKLDPKDVNTRLYLASLYKKITLSQYAYKEWEKVLELDNENKEAKNNLDQLKKENPDIEKSLETPLRDFNELF